MLIKTAELTDTALDWAVAIAAGYERYSAAALDTGHYLSVSGGWDDNLNREVWSSIRIDGVTFEPSTNWKQGGPIIDRENITVVRCNNDYVKVNGEFKHVPRWFADCPGQYYGYEAETSYEGEHFDPTFMIDASDGCYGPTSLVAAMRSYVRRKLGNEVDIPEELLS